MVLMYSKLRRDFHEARTQKKQARTQKRNSFIKRSRSAALAVSLIALQTLSPLSSFLIASRVNTALAADTGFHTPTTTHTPDNWDVNTVANIQTSNNQYVSEDDGSEQGYSNFSFPAIPATNHIDGIEVTAEAKSTDNNGCRLGVSLSWNDGANYTSHQYKNLGNSDNTSTLGGATDTWGRTWSASDFTNANFVLNIEDDDPGSSCSSSAITYVDFIQVKVYYSPVADLTITKTNNVGGVTTAGNSFNWILTVTNIGAASATFNNQDIIEDDLPSSNVTFADTSDLTVTTAGGTTGSVDCDISSSTLDCDDNSGGSSVVIPAGGSFSVTVGVTPTTNGTFANPRSGAGNICRVDPDNDITESNESNNDCSDSVTVNVDTGTANPALPNSCGLDVALVIDSSSSIDSAELTQMKTAYTSFLNAFLPATSTQFSVTDFDTTASNLQLFTNDLDLLTTAVNAPASGGSTNWEDGLAKAQDTFDPRPTKPNMVIFASDGNPNRTGTSGTSAAETAAVAAAKTVANSIKASGTRILALGIGNDLNVDNLKAISGPNVNTGLTSDVITSNFSTLATDLANLAKQLCGGTITTTKLIDEDGDLQTTYDQTPAENWEFDVNGSPSNPDATTTDDEGKTPAVEVDPGTYSVTETNQNDYHLLSATCTGATDNGSLSGNAVTGINVGNSDIVSCTFINTPKPKVTVMKEVTNDNGGTLGSSDFPLFVDNTQLASGESVVVEPGTHTLSETQQKGYSLEGMECVDQWGGLVDVNGQGEFDTVYGQQLTCTLTNNDIPAKLTVTKLVTNNNGGTLEVGDFPLNVDQLQVVSGVEVELNAGTYTVSETNQEGYTPGQWTGDCDPLNGSITLQIGIVYACTITNDDDAPSLELIKYVTNNNGGKYQPSDWTLSASGPTPLSGTGTVLSDSSFKAGTYVLDENGPSGYTPSDWTCEGGRQDGNSIDIALGEHVVCTITNDDQPGSLTLVKTVVNDNGGDNSANDFQGKINGNNVAWNAETVLDAGDYQASETVYAGYTASDWGGDCAADGTVTLLPGEHKTCTITNDDDAPLLNVTKHVVNDNGGTAMGADFKLRVNGTLLTDSKKGGGDVYDNSVTYAYDDAQANTSYDVTEDAMPGYEQTGLACVDDGTQQNLSIPFTMDEGQHVTCTITNNDIQPKLTVTKTVVNNNGGALGVSDFPLFVGATQVTSGAENGFDAGNYTLSETNHFGYQAGAWGGDCDVDGSITLEIGQTYACTITNDDIAPSLTVTKIVLNPYGDAAPVSNFPLFVDNTGVASGVATSQFDAGQHTVTETQQPGYTLDSISGDCVVSQVPTVFDIILSLGTSSSCTITNKAIQPKLIVTKHVINDNGGTEEAKDFTMTVTGNSQAVTPFAGDENGTEILLNEGSYSVDELADAGYAKTIGEGCSGTISIGEVKYCTITNNDIQPKLTLTKAMDGDQYGDTATANDFGLSIGGEPVASGDTHGKDVGSYQLNEAGLTGYSFTGITGDDKCPQVLGGNVDLALADDVHCVIHNTAIQPKLIVTKHVINDNSGTKQASDFTLNVNDNSQAVAGFPGNENGTEIMLNEGNYSVSELTDADYITTLSGDCNGTISLGEVKYCAVINDDVPHPAIHVDKSGPATAKAGSTAVYTFSVSNTGDVALNGITVEDDIAGTGAYQSGDTNLNQKLDVGETWVYTASYGIPASQTKDVVNTVNACGYEVLKGRELVEGLDLLQTQIDEYVEPEYGQQVCASDSHTTSIPQVLADATTEKQQAELVNTGAAILWLQWAIPALLILVNVSIYALTRKNSDA